MTSQAPLLVAPPPLEEPGEHHWNFSRLKKDAGCCGKAFLCLWAPFGLVLLLTRICMFFVLALLYPLAHRLRFGRKYIVVAQKVLGAVVRVTGREHLVESRTPLIVPNHISDFDACMIWAANPPAEQTLVVNEHWRPVIRVVQCLGWPINPIYTSHGNVRDTLREAIGDFASAERSGSRRSVFSSHPNQPLSRVLLFAEGKTSFGLMVMRFSQYAFTLGAPVVPVAMRLHNRWPMHIQCNGCSVLRNIAALFFLPWVTYEVTILPEETAGELDGVGFAEKVRTRICDSLGVPASELTAKDKETFAKRWRAEHGY